MTPNSRFQSARQNVGGKNCGNRLTCFSEFKSVMLSWDSSLTLRNDSVSIRNQAENANSFWNTLYVKNGRCGLKSKYRIFHLKCLFWGVRSFSEKRFVNVFSISKNYWLFSLINEFDEYIWNINTLLKTAWKILDEIENALDNLPKGHMKSPFFSQHNSLMPIHSSCVSYFTAWGPLRCTKKIGPFSHCGTNTNAWKCSKP